MTRLPVFFSFLSPSLCFCSHIPIGAGNACLGGWLSLSMQKWRTRLVSSQSTYLFCAYYRISRGNSSRLDACVLPPCRHKDIVPTLVFAFGSDLEIYQLTPSSLSLLLFCIFLYTSLLIISFHRSTCVRQGISRNTLGSPNPCLGVSLFFKALTSFSIASDIWAPSPLENLYVSGHLFIFRRSQLISFLSVWESTSQLALP